MAARVRHRFGEAPETRLRRALTGYLPQGPEPHVRAFPPEEAICHLADILRAERRRRWRAPLLWIGTGIASLAVSVFGDSLRGNGAGSDVVSFLIVLASASFFAWLHAQPRRVHDNALAAIPVLLPSLGVASLVPLIDIAAGLNPKRRWEDDLLSRIRDAVTPLLPAFLDAAALKPHHLAFLRRECFRKATSPAFRVGALLILADLGDREILPIAERWSRKHPDERVREAAAEVLRARSWDE